MAARTPDANVSNQKQELERTLGDHRGAYKASKPIPWAQFLQGYTPKVIIISAKCRLLFF